MALTLRKGAAPFRSAKRVLSWKEEDFLNQRAKDLEHSLHSKELQQGVNFEHRDKALLEKKLSELKSIKNRYGATRLDGQDRVKAEMELKRLETAIAQKWGGRVPTYQEYWVTPKLGGIRYMTLVNKIAKLNADPEYSAYVQRWKYVRRRMEPEDRLIDSTLHLFKHE